MKSLQKGILAVLTISASFGAAMAGGNANFVLGGRTLEDEDFWEPVEKHSAFGVNVDFGGEGWPIRLMAGLHGSATEETELGFDLKASVAELTFGVAKIWEAGNAHPFVGGGLASVTAEFEFGGFTVDDTSPGFYLHGGVFWRLGSRFNLGGELRLLRGTEIDFFGFEGDADYAQAGLLLGWGWPAGK